MNEYDLDIVRLAGQGYCCSQIVLQLALEVQGETNNGLIRAMAALCHGFPGNKGVCGALTGAGCLLAYYAGKGSSEEEEDKRLPLMLDELGDWFGEFCTERSHSIFCQDIVPGAKPDTTTCGTLLSTCYGKAMTILLENGFDPTTASEH